MPPTAPRPIPRDDSWEREGRPLSWWLQLLVEGEEADRDHAANMITCMCFGLPSPSDDLAALEPDRPPDSRWAAARAALRATVAATDFPAARFVRLLWQREEDTTRRSRARDPALTSRRLVPASGDIEMLVLRSLGPAVMAAPEALRARLEDPAREWQALASLEDAGPAGRKFLPDMLSRIDRLVHGGRSHHRAAVAAGRMAAGDATSLLAIAERLSSPAPAVRSGAAQALCEAGLDTAGAGPQFIASLRRRLEDADDDEWHHLVRALASVGRSEPAVRAQLIALARHDARGPGSLEARWAAWHRGSVIEALGYFTAGAPECVPVLTSAIDDFEEFDPDWSYSGPKARVARTLERLGEGASGAASALARHLHDRNEDYPIAIVHALGAMGPGAAAVLPELLRMREAENEDSPGDDEDPLALSREHDAVRWAIARIRGLL